MTSSSDLIVILSALSSVSDDCATEMRIAGRSHTINLV